MTRERAEDIALPRRVAAFAFFMVADFFYGWSWNTVDVLRPDIRAALGLTLTQAGSMYSAQGLGALVGAVVIGQLADRLGRRNALFGIMIGYALALAAGTLVTTYALVLGQRFVLGLFLGDVFPTVLGLYTSLFPRHACGKLAGFYNGTFNGSVVVLGLLANRFHIADWHVLMLLGAVPPLVLAPLAFVVVPDDRRLIPYGIANFDPAPRGKLPVTELFAPGLRRQTLLITLMVGLNFFGSQAFTGWQTTYLNEVRGVDPPPPRRCSAGSSRRQSSAASRGARCPTASAAASMRSASGSARRSSRYTSRWRTRSRSSNCSAARTV